MRLSILFASVLVFCTVQLGIGQSWITRIDTLYEEHVRSMVELSDKSIVFAGDMCIYPVADPCGKALVGRLDSIGQKLWLKSPEDIESVDAMAAKGNRIFLAGQKPPVSPSSMPSSCIGFVLDINGIQVAKSQIGENGDKFKSMVIAENGDLLFSGLTAFGVGLVARTDSLLGLLWRVEFGASDAIAIGELPSGEIQIWGKHKLKRLSSTGDLIFETDLEMPDLPNYDVIRVAHDFGLIAIPSLGFSFWPNRQLTRFDKDGVIMFTKQLDGLTDHSGLYGMTELWPSGDLLFTVNTGLLGGERRIQLYSSDGFLKGVHAFEDPTGGKAFYIKELLQTSGNGLVLSGAMDLKDLPDTLFSGQDSLFFAKWDSLPLLANQNLLTGHLFLDENQNCQKDSLETLVVGRTIIIKGQTDTYYATADSAGFFKIYLPDQDFFVGALLPSPYHTSCGGQDVLFTQTDTTAVELGLDKAYDCPYLTTELTIPRLRRCFSNPASVHFCNLGTIPADSAHLDLTLDPWLDLTAASEPFTALGGNVFRFELGEMAVFECRDIALTIKVDCDSTILGQTHCVEAHIFPDSSCLPPTALWSGASIEVDATCTNDTLRFFIQNTGSAPTSVPCDFIVIEDDVIMNVGQQSLGIGETVALEYPADGHFWRLEASQEPGHPGPSMPSVSVEGCNGWWPGSFGFWTAFPQDDGSPAVDIDCLQNIGSYDPNEKTAAPEGIDNQHFIQKNQDIEYTIHFQNTGTDTAFTVVVTDTIDQKLRPETLKLGGASHPFSWEIYGPGILKMSFEKINLPDSTTNLAGSQGWFSYRISQKNDLPDGSQIRNRAAIFFDFNPPILTNRTLHTIGSNFLTVKTWSPAQPNTQLSVFPNPTSDEATFLIKGDKIGDGDALVLQLFDVNGRLVLAKNFTKNSATISCDGLGSGLYFFKINGKNGEAVDAGKLLVE